MLVLATVFPVGATEDDKRIFFVVSSFQGRHGLCSMLSLQETLKCSVELLDMLGLYLVITRLLGRSEMKVMITAVGKLLLTGECHRACEIILCLTIGWGTAELLGTKVIPLWVGARGVEFSWNNLQTALDANINLVRLRRAPSL